MANFLRKKYENLTLTPGSGKISAVISISIGALAVCAALCFLFPNLLLTPEMRGLYQVDLMKTLLYIAVAISFTFGWYSTIANTRQRYGFTGIGLALSATILSALPVGLSRYEIRGVYVGLDYFVLTLLILALVFIPLERAFSKNADQLTLRKGWVTDIKYFMFSHLGVQLIAFFTIIPVQVLLHRYTDNPIQNWVYALPLWVQFFMILAVVDIGTYWIHRAMHEVPWLWKFHAVHHSSEHMDWLASSRLHVVEILANRFAGYLPIFLLGFAPAAVFAYLVFISFHAIFIHANVRFRFPVIRHLIATPEFHHWHHSSEDAAIDKNYAAFLPIYDRIFGTYYLPKHLASKYGTVSDDIPEGMWGQFLYPFNLKPKTHKMPTQPASAPNIKRQSR